MVNSGALRIVDRIINTIPVEVIVRSGEDNASEAILTIQPYHLSGLFYCEERIQSQSLAVVSSDVEYDVRVDKVKGEVSSRSG
jgi:hypothetical protein